MPVFVKMSTGFNEVWQRQLRIHKADLSLDLTKGFTDPNEDPNDINFKD